MVNSTRHDSSGWVPLEAGASGLPVVCLNLGGPGKLITEKTGIKVEAIEPEQSIEDLGKALCTLAENPELYNEMSRAGRRLIQENYLWDCIGEYFRTSAVYQIGASDEPLEQPQIEPPVESKI